MTCTDRSTHCHTLSMAYFFLVMHFVIPCRFTKCRILPTRLDLKLRLCSRLLPARTSTVAAKHSVSVSGGSRRWVQPRVKIAGRLPKATDTPASWMDLSSRLPVRMYQVYLDSRLITPPLQTLLTTTKKLASCRRCNVRSTWNGFNSATIQCWQVRSLAVSSSFS
jgi:hypothetical protein